MPHGAFCRTHEKQQLPEEMTKKRESVILPCSRLRRVVTRTRARAPLLLPWENALDLKERAKSAPRVRELEIERGLFLIAAPRSKREPHRAY